MEFVGNELKLKNQIVLLLKLSKVEKMQTQYSTTLLPHILQSVNPSPSHIYTHTHIQTIFIMVLIYSSLMLCMYVCGGWLQAIKESGGREGASTTFQFFKELDAIFNPTEGSKPAPVHSRPMEAGEYTGHLY